MSFATPLALILLVPLLVLLVLSATRSHGWAGRLPGTWDRVVAPTLKRHVAVHSNLGKAGAPVLAIGLAALVVLALARPGVDADDPRDIVTLGGRVIVLDVGEDLAGHQLFIDALHDADPAIATAIIAVAGDAYRIVPFTTDKAQIDRYVQVLSADMMPAPGNRPHLGIARAEKILLDAGYLVRQIVLVTAKRPPEQSVAISQTETQRIVVPLFNPAIWQDWADTQHSTLADRESVSDIAETLADAIRAAARSELPATRLDLATILIGITALLWLLLFRRRAG